MAIHREERDTPLRRWIKAIRATYGLNQEDLAPIVNRGRSSINGYENGNPVPDDVILTLLREFPDVPPPKDVALPESVERPFTKPVLSDATYLEAIPYVELPYAGEVPATSWGGPLEADTTIKVDGKFKGPNRFGARVVGDSCYPALRQGDETIWESDRNPPHGVIVIAERNEDDGCTVKQLVYDAVDQRDVLKPVNPRYEPPPDGSGWRATARLVGVIRKSDGPERTWYWPHGLRPKHLMPEEE